MRGGWRAPFRPDREPAVPWMGSRNAVKVEVIPYIGLSQAMILGGIRLWGEGKP
jgi:hypothetical protein